VDKEDLPSSFTSRLMLEGHYSRFAIDLISLADARKPALVNTSPPEIARYREQMRISEKRSELRLQLQV
jgi:hypothetical protein